jgi:hypothetical protein
MMMGHDRSGRALKMPVPSNDSEVVQNVDYIGFDATHTAIYTDVRRSIPL